MPTIQMNTPTAATATITFTGNATTNQIITITSTDGTELTYTAKTSGNSAARTFDGNNGAATCASTLKSAIEDSTASTGGHAGRITVSIDGAVLTLTQATKGAAGNIAITARYRDPGKVRFLRNEDFSHFLRCECDKGQ